MSAPIRREQVRYMVTQGLSERRALAVLYMIASAYRYQPAHDRNVELRELVLAFAQRYKRYGVGITVPTRSGRWISCLTGLRDDRPFKALVIVGDGTHELVAIEVERAISGHGVARILDRLALQRGLPQAPTSWHMLADWAGVDVLTDPAAYVELSLAVAAACADCH